MNLKSYILESEKQYMLRIKTIVPLDDEAMDAIEMAVAKYMPLKLSNPKKSIMQANPMDFVNYGACEVYIMDMTFALPVSAPTLREDLRKALNTSEESIVIRYSNDAMEIESERTNAANEIEADRKKKNLKYGALLDTGKEFPEAEEHKASDYFGDEYNGAFLAQLKKIRDERDDMKVKAANAPFVWLDIPDRSKQEPYQSDVDFNKDIKGAPKVNGTKTNDKVGKNKITGSVDDRVKVTRLMKDKDGNRVVASKMMGDI